MGKITVIVDKILSSAEAEARRMRVATIIEEIEVRLMMEEEAKQEAQMSKLMHKEER